MPHRAKWTAILLLALISAAAHAEEGIPSSEWTAQEQQLVQQMRAAYQKRDLPFTDEQAGIAVKTMREKIARITGQIAATQAAIGAMPALAAPSAAPAPAQAAPSAPAAPGSPGNSAEADLGARYAAFPPKSGELQIEDRADGFLINGQPFLDPEGTLTDYAVDVLSGNIGYVLNSPGGQVVKVTRAGTGTSITPLKIATARESNSQWQVSTTTGKNLVGERFSVTPNGFLVSRATAAFLYQTGQELATHVVPNGYVLATYERGDVDSTGHVLLEKDPSATTGTGQKSGGLFKSFKDLANPFAQKHDFALLHLQSGRQFPLDIPSNAKKVSTYSDCQRQNDFVNKCATVTRAENLYQPDGRRNEGHYYWRIQWFNTPKGPLLIALENDLAELNVIDLASGRKAHAFIRAMGISGFEAKQDSAGVVKLTYGVVFRKQEIPDVAAFLASAQPIAPPAAR